MWKKICKALCSRSILCNPLSSLVAVKECGNWIVLFCHCLFVICTQTSKKIVVFFFHQTVQEHWADIRFLSSSRIICTWAYHNNYYYYWLFIIYLSIIIASFSPWPYWNNIPNLLKVPRVAWNMHHEHGHQTSRGDCYTVQTNVGQSGSTSRFKFKELGLMGLNGNKTRHKVCPGGWGLLGTYPSFPSCFTFHQNL
jgi:hypothetical protein